MYVAGIDIGSTTAEALILKIEGHNDKTDKILGTSIMKTGFNQLEAAEKCFSVALKGARLEPSHISYIVATGYGRNNVSFAGKQVTEIVCHARGALYCFPDTKLVIDIGGQDSKVIKLDHNGKVADFSMNEKCAAGTGRFIEVMANVLQVELDQMGALSFLKQKDVSISSMCTVFAESEIISKITQGHRREDIIKGLHNAVADRVLPMARRVGIENDIVMTGGVARNKGVIASFEEKLDAKIYVPEDPQMMGALGAAVIASEEALQNNTIEEMRVHAG